MRASLTSAAAILVALSMSGCTAMQNAAETIAVTKSQAMRDMASMPPREKMQQDQPIIVDDGIYITDGTAIINDRGDRLPTGYSAFTWNSMASMPLKDVAAKIQADTGLRVVIETDAGAERQTTAAATTAPSMIAPGWGPPPSAMVPQSVATATGRDVRVAVGTFSGPLSKFLDLVAQAADMVWSYDQSRNEVVFRDTITKVFTLYALPSSITTQANRSAGTKAGDESSTDSASGSTSQKTMVSTQIRIWKEVEEALKSLLPSRDGKSRYSVAPSTGTITVTTTPASMRVVEDYIQQQNDIMSRTVAVTVNMITVQVDESDEFGLDVSAVLNDLGGRYAWNLVGPPSGASVDAGSVTAAVVSGGDSSINRRFGGSQAVIRALSRHGEIVQSRRNTVYARNNQMVPVTAVSEVNYVDSISLPDTNSSGSSTPQVNSATISVGYAMNIMPRILEDGSIILEYSIDQSTLDSLDDFDVGGGFRVQRPEKSIRSFYQQVPMHSGEVLVMAGLDEIDSRFSRTGQGHPDFIGFGGGRSGSNTRTVSYIMLEPVLIKTGFNKETYKPIGQR